MGERDGVGDVLRWGGVFGRAWEAPEVGSITPNVDPGPVLVEGKDNSVLSCDVGVSVWTIKGILTGGQGKVLAAEAAYDSGSRCDKGARRRPSDA